jgi:DNA-binding winged helix-turn-helix (wHTH) protein/tetratricopeptide (TPR) repeat protein
MSFQTCGGSCKCRYCCPVRRRRGPFSSTQSPNQVRDGDAWRKSLQLAIRPDAGTMAFTSPWCESGMAAEIFRFEDFELDRSAYELRRAGRSVRLERIPLDLLFLLVERHGQLVTRQEIVDRVWGKEVFLDTEHGINTAARKIRLALSDNPEVPRFVLTVPAKGYRFVASVEKVEATPVAVPPNGHPSQESPAAAPSRETQKKGWKTLILAGVFVAVLAAAAVLRFPHVEALKEKDRIVIADFANSTGDAVFDGTLKQGLAVQLEQSPFLSLVSEDRVQQTLRLMGQSPEAHLTPKIARELCQRTHSAVVLDGSIASLGSQYVLGLKAVDCLTGDFLAQEQVTAGSKERVLKGLDEAATKLRERLGESLSTLQKFDTPIEQATTPSLEALKAYSVGEKVRHAKGDSEALPFFQRAVELDPNFAMAFSRLALAYANLGKAGLANENMQKAFTLREAVSDREKLSISGLYYVLVSGDLDQAVQTYELWAHTYSRDGEPHRNLGDEYGALGQLEKAAAEAREAIRLDPEDGISYSNLIELCLALGRLDEANAHYQRAMGRGLEYSGLHLGRYAIAFLESDAAEMQRRVFEHSHDDSYYLSIQSDTEAFFGRLKKARELSRQAVDLSLRSNENPANWKLYSALREAEIGNPIQSRKQIAEVLGVASTREAETLAALALARSGDSDRAASLADDVNRRYPLNTIVNRYWLPTIRASIELNRNNPSRALDLLQVTVPYELGISAIVPSLGSLLYPVYVRGQAYLRVRRGAEAAAEFQKLLDNRGSMLNSPLFPLAQLGLARAFALQGDTAKARAAYQDFLTLWKDADPDTPILKEAKAEHAKLQ